MPLAQLGFRPLWRTTARICSHNCRWGVRFIVMIVCIFGSLDDPLQIWDTNIISHHILHAIEPFEAFHPLMSKANDLVQAFHDRQEILAQAPHGEFPTWWSWWHEDIKCVWTIWLICLSLWNCFAFVAREFWWLRRICGNCWVFWLDFDHFPSLMQAAAVKQEIKEELLQEIGRWLSDWFGTGRPFGRRSIPICFLKIWFVLMDFGFGTCLTNAPHKKCIWR